ncbi:hypothetical protein APP_19470 [Aeribacillus pallidus]|nr:hypothetical protein APP_19470 [Aeribacillus pallidus]
MFYPKDQAVNVFSLLQLEAALVRYKKLFSAGERMIVCHAIPQLIQKQARRAQVQALRLQQQKVKAV